MWQTLETKCRFIAQVMIGDPPVVEKASVDAEALRLTRLKKQHADSQYHIC
jgi:hypothetical protein